MIIFWAVFYSLSVSLLIYMTYQVYVTIEEYDRRWQKSMDVRREEIERRQAELDEMRKDSFIDHLTR